MTGFFARRRWGVAALVPLLLLLLTGVALADTAPASSAAPLTWEEFRDHLQLTDRAALDASPLATEGGYAVDTAWTLLAAVLVFWMQAGFALIEAGFTRAKNTVNILMKNLLDFCFGSIAFWAVGFGLMFGVTNGFLGTTGFFLSGHADDTWSYTFLMFQTVFCATSATIVSGAMAERTHFAAYLIYSIAISIFIYPVFGSWAWGGLYEGGGWLEAPAGGFLARLGLPPFIDFAGSTVVHSIGGWAALAGVLAVGPRLGKYTDGALPIRGHSMALATLGVFILWMGWFGFNAGSTTGVTAGAEPLGGAGKAVGLIAVNTNLAGCAGAISALLTTWLRLGKPEVSMTLNGVLAGLVGVTAGCASVTPPSALAIGAIAGIIVVFAVDFFEALRLDDPVGAISVHGVCGVWGTLAAGLFHHQGFSGAQIATQLIGIGAAFVWSFGTASVLFFILKKTVRLRASAEDEEDGLDLAEHGAEAYPRENVPG